MRLCGSRTFGGGWNRHYRRWHLPRKVICFFYPHTVVSAASEAIPGSQVYSTTPPAELVDGAKAFLLPAGSFVIMHSNMWHRGTKELCAPAPRISTFSQNPLPPLDVSSKSSLPSRCSL